ncbi:Nucleotidyl transferase domain and Poly(A) polymerase [Paragonimus heterotremus]|uniref:polynucleotide adenylyltransferase n=1 Tax=Paragonimus heterotremus TaxID=100268 RepID=A0A8J4TJI2_9TREM|nr:Nucleotidyl transferase domain and Poly(A) polymerase [Paragonimus heterotremus]
MGSKVGDEIPARCLGETGALSFKKPTEQDLKDTQELETSLAQLNIFETAEEMTQRREALVRLQEISNKWIRQKALEQNLPLHVANSTTGKIFTFGSYRLGVNFSGADIDSLLVVPRFISREEFFGEFQTVLTEDPHVENIHAVVDAYVPVLKMKFMGVDIDLLFAQVDQMNIAENFNLCENTEMLMRNMDERDVRSINGVRVTEDILNLVHNKNSFKVALKVIRIWAKRRNIYSNALGFLGGVSWAILVSRICQLYPYATPSILVYSFFKIFSQWPWPKPVRLRESEYIPSLCLPVWDPRLNPPDQYHLMPILTPSYPSQNSTYNVQRSNRIIIERELKLGLSIAADALMHKQPWSNLFESAFFFHYRHYVVVIVTGSVQRSFVELCGLVESRLRVLISNFEMNRYVKIAHVNCGAYGKGACDGDAELVRKWFIGMEFDRNPNSLSNLTTANAEKPTLNVDLSEQINSFEKSIERGLSNDDPTNSVTVKYAKKSQLSQFVSAEDMEEIKRQAAAAAISASANKASDPIKASPRLLNSSDQSDNLSSPASLTDLFSGGASPASLQRTGSCASMVDVTLKTNSPATITLDSADSSPPLPCQKSPLGQSIQISKVSAVSNGGTPADQVTKPSNPPQLPRAIPAFACVANCEEKQARNKRSPHVDMACTADCDGEQTSKCLSSDGIKRSRLTPEKPNLLNSTSAR